MSSILPDGQCLGLARQALSAGGPLPAGVLSPAVQRSWERTRAAGMRPDDQALFQHYVSLQEMRRVQDCHHALIDLARDDMEQLWRSVRSPDWVVLLTDPSGTIVHSLGSHEHAPRELRMPLRAGRRLQECELGTNAPGVVASEGVAAEVRGEEHFLAELRRFSCAAAPLFGLQGQVMGVLDITGFDVPWDGRVMERVQIACRSIESREFERTSDGLLLRLHEDRRFLGTPAQGLLWLREDGVILAANRIARTMLGLSLMSPLTPLRVDQVFDWQRTAFRSYARGSDANRLIADSAPIFTQSGVRFFAHLESRAFTSVSSGPDTGARRNHRGSGRIALPGVGCQPQTDPQWQLAFERASRVFPAGLPVLLHGETGTGKEWFARALHEAHRGGKPFIAINCAALADGVAESELFGHVEGAFTGSRKGGAPGRVEQAQGGTLFLDEIGDMPIQLQTRLLRVLQERRVTRVGSGEEIPLDVLLVAASHRDLRQLVDRGCFREDLYFRLNGLKVRLPALRERLDLDALISACLQQFSQGLQRPISISNALRTRLHDYAWPGNIRQLWHALHVGALLSDETGLIDEESIALEETSEDMGANPGLEPDASDAPGEQVRANTDRLLLSHKQKAIMEQLAAHAGNISAAARSLGVSRTTLYKYLSLTRGNAKDSNPGV